MPDEAWRKLAARKWAELEAVEVEGRMLFEDRIRRRKKGGALEEVPIRVRVLRKDEARKAFFEAVKWAQDEGLLPADLAGVANVREKALDPKAFDDLETLCILARAIRDVAPPYDQHHTHKRLEAEYDMRSLEELWTKYKLYEDATDPRESIKTDAEFWAVAATIRSTGTIAPLTEFVSPEQNAFILRTVDLALSSPAFKSWCTQFASSTPAS
jgi:hypothetical protein